MYDVMMTKCRICPLRQVVSDYVLKLYKRCTFALQLYHS